MFTLTTTQLLEGLADPANQAVWQVFDARYRPVLLAFARRLDLSAEDAADVAQEALTRFMTALREGRFDRDRGRLRSWMVGIARHIRGHDQCPTGGPRKGAGGVGRV